MSIDNRGQNDAVSQDLFTVYYLRSVSGTTLFVALPRVFSCTVGHSEFKST